jgi:hypothetical protein
MCAIDTAVIKQGKDRTESNVLFVNSYATNLLVKEAQLTNKKPLKQRDLQLASGFHEHAASLRSLALKPRK